ncbi:hypothetical protein SK066_19245 [Paenibacillus hunanensis]|uniref:hypothetical protein n=1 Tax=Paenibacillus hunanensis TaxID=539262 RepID=UPI002A6B345F|nr:hypothetical protein [Paenibacillus hunanensis]WPP40712.1 hypothetical protein SK066_19245 [Paenibacillus hunanensis]
MNESLETFITESEKQLNTKANKLEESRNRIFEFIKENIMPEVGIKNLTVQGRVKQKESLREKIIRKNYFIDYNTADEFINELTDIIGIRIVCLLEKEEKLLFEELDKLFTQIDNGYHVIPDTNVRNDYLRINKLNQPKLQKNGYEIYKLDCQWVSGKSVINVELQLKSLVHMFWGEIEHMLFYKNYAYMVGAEFYRNYMDSTKQLLNAVDHQLDIMKNQMFARSSSKQIEESRQMVTKLVYNTYQPVVTRIYKCDLDLREVYDLAIHIKFQGIFESNEALSRTTEIINILNSTTGQMNDTTFMFESYKPSQSSLSEELKKVSCILDTLIKENDVFWKTLFATLKLLLKENNSTKILDQTSEKLMNFFTGLNEEFDEGTNEVTDIVIKDIQSGIIKAFEDYKKLDFFSPSIHQSDIYESILIFIRENRESFYELENDPKFKKSKEKLSHMISSLITIKINSIVNKKVTNADLRKLNELVNDSDMVWIPEIHRDNLEKVTGKNVDIDRKEFNSLFQKSEEHHE